MPLRTCCSASGPSSSWPRYLQAARQAGQVCGGKGQVSEWWGLRRVVQTADAVKQWRECVWQAGVGAGVQGCVQRRPQFVRGVLCLHRGALPRGRK
jgi:hypothetical protein